MTSPPPTPPARPPKPRRRMPSRSRSESPPDYDPLLEFLPLHLLTVSAAKLDLQYSIQDTSGRDAIDMCKIVLVQNLMTDLRARWDTVSFFDFCGIPCDSERELEAIEEEGDATRSDPNQPEADCDETTSNCSDDTHTSGKVNRKSLEMDGKTLYDSDADSGVDVSGWSDDDLEAGIPPTPTVRSKNIAKQDKSMQQDVLEWMQGLDFFSDLSRPLAAAAEPVVLPTLEAGKIEQEVVVDDTTISDCSSLLDQVFDISWSLAF